MVDLGAPIYGYEYKACMSHLAPHLKHILYNHLHSNTIALRNIDPYGLIHGPHVLFTTEAELHKHIA
jgi:hypothetical protein